MPIKDREKAREYQRRYRQENAAKRNASKRRTHLQRKYGITPEQYDALNHSQRGVCALCGEPPRKNRLAIDHDHKTGKVRALLCYRCNYFRVNAHTLATAQQLVEYLRRHAA